MNDKCNINNKNNTNDNQQYSFINFLVFRKTNLFTAGLLLVLSKCSFTSNSKDNYTICTLITCKNPPKFG